MQNQCTWKYLNIKYLVQNTKSMYLKSISEILSTNKNQWPEKVFRKYFLNYKNITGLFTGARKLRLLHTTQE